VTKPPREPGLGWMLILTFAMLPVTIGIVWLLQTLGLLR
jgi:hypothetical protein